MKVSATTTKMNLLNTLKSVNFVKVMLGSTFLIAFGFIFSGFVLSKVIRMAMKMQLRVTPGTMSRDIYEQVPFPIDMKYHFFNITNPDEVMAGGKPHLHEIGPYYFEEWKTKVDIIDDNAEDTMEYDYINTIHFRPDLSAPGLTGDEFVVLAHPLILGMAMSIKRERPELLGFINNAINGLFHDPKNIFYSGRLFDLLFDGIYMDCSSEAFEISGVCSELGSDDHAEVTIVNDTTYSFALFDHANGSSIGRFKVMRGKKNIRELGKIIEFNSEEIQDIWYDDECNQVHGTDGTIFAPFMKKEDGVQVFVAQLCRSFVANYKHPSKVSGIKTSHYEVNVTASADCYCSEDAGNCPAQGQFDIMPCVGAPITVTLPHFHEADTSLMDDFKGGLHPITEKHSFYFDFYDFAGAPISAAGRLQLNFEVEPVEEIEMMNNLQPMLLPFAWFENGVDLKKKFVNMLKYQLILGLKLKELLKIACITFGFAGLIVGSVMGYLQMNEETMNKTEAVQVQAAAIKNGTSNHLESDNHDEDREL